MNDRPFPEFEGIDTEVGDDARGITVVRPRPEQPAIIDMRETCIRAADHSRDAGLGDGRGSRLNLGAAYRPDDCNDVAAAAELRECKHGSGVRALVILDLQLDAP